MDAEYALQQADAIARANAAEAEAERLRAAEWRDFRAEVERLQAELAASQASERYARKEAARLQRIVAQVGKRQDAA